MDRGRRSDLDIGSTARRVAARQHLGRVADQPDRSGWRAFAASSTSVIASLELVRDGRICWFAGARLRCSASASREANPAVITFIRAAHFAPARR